MRKRGMMLSALGLGLWWSAERVEREFRGVAGRVATVVSPKWRGRREVIRAGSNLGRKAALAGAFWALVPRRRRRQQED